MSDAAAKRPTALPGFEIDEFRLLSRDDLYSPCFPNWSRAYEWNYVLRRLLADPTRSVHNTCCGHSDGHALFHDRLVELCPRTVNSDRLRRGRNAEFRGFFEYDVCTPLDRTFDCVLCISTLEEIWLQDPRRDLLARILANLLGQVRPGGRLIVTCDVSTPDKPVYRLSGAIEVEVLEDLLGARCGVPEVRLTGIQSAYPDPNYADLEVCLIDLTRVR